jgi:hypothetical protein
MIRCCRRFLAHQTKPKAPVKCQDQKGSAKAAQYRSQHHSIISGLASSLYACVKPDRPDIPIAKPDQTPETLVSSATAIEDPVRTHTAQIHPLASCLHVQAHDIPQNQITLID